MIKDIYRCDFNKKRFGVKYFQCKELDCIDLYIEMSILLNCKWCRSCIHLLKWVVKILVQKWDDIRFINLEEALSLSSFYKNILQVGPVLQHFKINRSMLKKSCIRQRKKKHELIKLNSDFFFNSIEKYNRVRNFIFTCLVSNIDLYNVDSLKID